MARPTVLLPESLHGFSTDLKALANLSSAFAFFLCRNNAVAQIMAVWSHGFLRGYAIQLTPLIALRQIKSKML